MDIYILTQLKSKQFSDILFCLPNLEVLLPVSAIYLSHFNFLLKETKMHASTELRATCGNDRFSCVSDENMKERVDKHMKQM